MLTITFVNLVAVICALASRFRWGLGGFEAAFFVVFSFLALRYNFGNDYKAYFDAFYQINRVTDVDYINSGSHFEPGWVFLCRLFEPFGFFAMTAFLAAVNCIVYYLFISKFVPKNYYWLAVILYLFNPGLMLTHASAMRQSLAISLFLVATLFLVNKRVAPFVLLVVLASLFHFSAIVLLPFAVVGVYEIRLSTRRVVGFGMVFLALFFLGDQILPMLETFIGEYFVRYSVYDGSIEVGSGLGVLLNSLFLALILWNSRFKCGGPLILAEMAIVGYLFIPLALVLAFFGRIAMYFQPALIVVLITAIIGIENRAFRVFMLLLLILSTSYQYSAFFSSETYADAFADYTTIFSAPRAY